MTSIDSRLLATAAAVVLCSLPVVAQAPAKGDLWAVVSQMTMEGMPMKMPAQTTNVCVAKVWTQPPGPENPRQQCTRANYRIDGDKIGWTESCTEPTMTGEGEITRTGADAYTGVIKYSSSEGNMTINLTGSKIGECDNPK